MPIWLMAGMLFSTSDQSGTPFGLPGTPAPQPSELPCFANAAVKAYGTKRLKPGILLSTQDITELRLQDQRYLRVLGPKDVGTMDWQPNRLNVHLDPNGRIARLSCG